MQINNIHIINKLGAPIDHTQSLDNEGNLTIELHLKESFTTLGSNGISTIQIRNSNTEEAACEELKKISKGKTK